MKTHEEHTNKYEHLNPEMVGSNNYICEFLEKENNFYYIAAFVIIFAFTIPFRKEVVSPLVESISTKTSIEEVKKNKNYLIDLMTGDLDFVFFAENSESLGNVCSLLANESFYNFCLKWVQHQLDQEMMNKIIGGVEKKFQSEIFEFFKELNQSPTFENFKNIKISEGALRDIIESFKSYGIRST